MPRRSREEAPGAFHHVFAHAVGSEPLFVDDADMEAYLRLLEKVVGIYGLKCLGYCLMGNHIHLLIQTPEPNLGRAMQRLHGQYARGFNGRHAANGHRFNGRYGNKRIKTDAQFFAVVRYIALNPMEAGLCRVPEDWAWSSHGLLLRRETPPWFDARGLLEFFGALGGDPLVRYLRRIEG